MDVPHGGTWSGRGKFVDGDGEVVDGGVGVDLGGGDAGVSEGGLDDAEVGDAEEAGGKGVTEDVGGDGVAEGVAGEDGDLALDGAGCGAGSVGAGGEGVVGGGDVVGSGVIDPGGEDAVGEDVVDRDGAGAAVFGVGGVELEVVLGDAVVEEVAPCEIEELGEADSGMQEEVEG